MKNPTRPAAALLAVTALGLPATEAYAATAAAPKKTTAKKKISTAVRTIVGPLTDMHWGPVQVTIKVKGAKIVDITATYPTERPKSQFINDDAVPILRSEALAAQSSQIDLLTQATMVSVAYAQSLQGAIDKAKLPAAGQAAPGVPAGGFQGDDH